MDAAAQSGDQDQSVTRTLGTGRSTAIKYTVQIVVPGTHNTASEWRPRSRLNGNVPGHGAPTAENLAKYVRGFEESTLAGGCNAHVGATKVASARIVNQETKQVLATYSAS